MRRDQIHLLLHEAQQASDPKAGLLHCYEDLQDVLRQLVRTADALLAENERLAGRLRWSAMPPDQRPAIADDWYCKHK